MKLNPNVPLQLHDFCEYQKLMWRHLRWPNPDRVAKDIARTIQTGPRRMVVCAYREATKTATTVAFGGFTHLHDVEAKELIASGSGTFSDLIANWMWSLLNEFPILRHLCPVGEQRKSMRQFDIAGALPSKEPSVVSIGIEGQATGRRADIIILDDVETPQNTETEHLRAKLRERIIEFDNILRNNEHSRFLVLGTPHSEESVYPRLEERGFKIFYWPQRYPTPEYAEYLGDRLAPMLREELERDPSLGMGGGIDGNLGKPTNPERFPEHKCCEKELQVGARQYRLQYLLDPRMTDEVLRPLRLKNWIVMDVDLEMGPMKATYSSDSKDTWQDLPCVGFSTDRYQRPADVTEIKPYLGRVMMIDPAGQGLDEMAWMVTAGLNSQIFVIDWGGVFGGPTEGNILELAKAAVRNRVNLVRIEDNFGDGTIQYLLLPVLKRLADEVGLTVGVECEPAHKKKEVRIVEWVEPMMSSHRMIVNKEALIREYQERRPGIGHEDRLKFMLAFQVSRFHSKAKDGGLEHDDRLDVLASSCHYWNETMGLDQAKQILRQRRKDAQSRSDSQRSQMGLGKGRNSLVISSHYGIQPTRQQTRGASSPNAPRIKTGRTIRFSR